MQVITDTTTTFKSAPLPYIDKHYMETKRERQVLFREHTLRVTLDISHYNNSWMDETSVRVVVESENSNSAPKAALWYWSYWHDYHQDVDPELEVEYEKEFPLSGLSMADSEELCGQAFEHNLKSLWNERECSPY